MGKPIGRLTQRAARGIPSGTFAFILLVSSVSLAAQGTQSQEGEASIPELTEFGTETIASMREITLQLILLATGVFGLVGGFLASSERRLTSAWLLSCSFALLGMSVILGLLAYGNLIWQLASTVLDPFGAISLFAMWQWITFAAGGALFAVFVLLNVHRGPPASGSGGGT